MICTLLYLIGFSCLLHKQGFVHYFAFLNVSMKMGSSFLGNQGNPNWWRISLVDLNLSSLCFLVAFGQIRVFFHHICTFSFFYAYDSMHITWVSHVCGDSTYSLVKGV